MMRPSKPLIEEIGRALGYAVAERHHDIDVLVSPIGHMVRCSCGWSRFIPRQNALARAAKVKAAIRQHTSETSR